MHMKAAWYGVMFILLLVFPADTLSAPGIKAEQDRTPYTFAVIPYYSPEKIWTLFTPFVEHLRKSTGQPWTLRLYHNHEEFIADLCGGRISMALAGPAPLSSAHETCGVRPLLVALTKNGQPTYHSMLVTTDPAVKNLKGLTGKRIGFFKGSTAAHIMPVKMLMDAGVHQTDIRAVFLESQDRILSALLAGEISAGGMKETLYQKFGSHNLRVVATSPPLPNFALCVLPSFPAKAREKVVSSLIRLKPRLNPHDAKIVRDWDDEIKNGFMLPGEAFLPSVIAFRTLVRDVTNDSR